MDNIRLFRKTDIIIITVAIIIAAIFFVLPVLRKSDDKKIYVTKADGLGEYLSINEDGVYTYESEFGTNVITIENGTVCVSYSDCKNQICVNHGPISNPGDTICCLPHRFAVTVTGANDGE